MSRSILLVDDDRGFSSLAQAALAREGHPVVLARSLHEAATLRYRGEVPSSFHFSGRR